MFKKIRSIALKTGAAAGLLAFSVAAHAGTTDDAFTEFMDTVIGWATGPLGVGLAVTMLLIGAGMGVARNSPLPALSGIAAAAILHWGPTIITEIMAGGATF